MSRKVYIGRLNDQVRERDVDHFFRGFHVRDIMLKNGYGFVVRFNCSYTSRSSNDMY